MNSAHSTPVAIIGAGFIGKHLMRALLAQGANVRVLDRNDCPAEFERRVAWTKGDFHDQAALRAVLAGSATAYHLVSSTVPGDQHVDVAWELHENVVGSLRFVEACIEQGVRRIVFTSSASVYGVQETFPVRETAATNPISAHGIHKLTVEKFLLLAQRERGLDVRILRLANPYGPGQSLTGRQGFVAIAIGCLLRGESLTLRDGGRMVRDFIYVEDAARALAQAGLQDGCSHVLNIGAGQAHTLREVLDIIEDLTGQTVRTILAEPRQVDIPASVLDIGLASAELGFSPQTPLREGIAKTLLANGLALAKP